MSEARLLAEGHAPCTVWSLNEPEAPVLRVVKRASKTGKVSVHDSSGRWALERILADCELVRRTRHGQTVDLPANRRNRAAKLLRDGGWFDGEQIKVRRDPGVRVTSSGIVRRPETP